MSSEKGGFLRRFKWHALIICLAVAIVVVLTIFTDIFHMSETNLLRQLVLMLGVLVFVAALIYLWVYPLVEVEYESGVKLGQINSLAVWLVFCMVLSFIFLLIKKTKALFSSLVAMVVSTILIFLILIVPSINPYRSTKQLAGKLDRLIPADEDLVFYRRIKESALFYTHRKARVLMNPEELKDYLASDKKVKQAYLGG